MKRFNNSKITLLLLAFTFALILSTGSANADFMFGEPVLVGSGLGNGAICCFSSDGLEMYFYSYSLQVGGQGVGDLWVLRRASKEEDWGPAENLGPVVNSPAWEFTASISADGLALYFASDRLYGDDSSYDIYMATRATKNDPWGLPVRMEPEINGPDGANRGAWISPDNLELYINSTRSGGYSIYDIWVARRANANDPWSEAVNLGPIVNTASSEAYCSLSPDGLLLLFSAHFGTTGTRPGSYGLSDLWMARRASLSEPWQTPVNLGPMVNGPASECMPRISPDGHTLYFECVRSSNWECWQAPIIPIVDFNGDGAVDAADMRIMVEHWRTDEPLCDIGPMPWGDGIVDVQDLIVLSEHLFEEVNDPTLVAHWALDETEGMFAADSAGDNDAFVVGGAAWQPGSGQVDGAIQLNGIDGCAIAGSVLNPADGPFGIFAWVNGGAPGQVVVSQQGAANLLAVDGEGNLMTELKSSDQLAGPLLSETVITDGQWHRIGLVWDGLYRTLYVDDIAVAEDTQDSLDGSSNGLYIGTGKAMEAGTYWSGLIDDVRIYNRAVSP